MKHISASAKWKYGLGILLLSFFSSAAFAQITYVVGVDTAFKHVNDANVIYYNSDTVKLKGYLYKPEGKGPFPVYIWNHGEEKNPDPSASLISFWVKHGFIFFMPIRSGQGNNPGAYIRDGEKQIRRKKEMEAVQWKQVYALHQKANNDVLAALKWIKQQPNIDTNNIVASGEGYGAIQVLLTAEKDGQSSLGIKSFMAFSPGSEIWSKMWSDSLKQTLIMAKRPIFILDMPNDNSLPPIDTVASVIGKKGFPDRYKLFPFLVGFSTDTKAWEKDVMQYLKDCKVKRMKD
jgi:dienelactone hydrolase